MCRNRAAHIQKADGTAERACFYPRNFYTANLLLSWRWMIVVPVLIVAFYLLYIVKSRYVAQAANHWQRLLSLLIAALVVFVGFCWTGNYMVSTDEAAWTTIYASGAPRLAWMPVLLRMGVWLLGSFATLGLCVAWQMADAKRIAGHNEGSFSRGGSWLVCFGIIASSIAGIGYFFSLDATQRQAILSAGGQWYMAVAMLGGGLQLAGWIFLIRGNELRTRVLTIISLGYASSLIGVSAAREIVRLSEINVEELYALHAESAHAGGWLVFAVFCVINFALIAFCVALVRQNLAPKRFSN